MNPLQGNMKGGFLDMQGKGIGSGVGDENLEM